MLFLLLWKPFVNVCIVGYPYRYGVILEHFQRQDPSVMNRIKGCIVDSAPVAYPDPEVKAITIFRFCCL